MGPLGHGVLDAQPGARTHRNSLASLETGGVWCCLSISRKIRGSPEKTPVHLAGSLSPASAVLTLESHQACKPKALGACKGVG